MPDTAHYSLTGSGKPIVFQHGLGANLNQVLTLLNGLEKIQLLTSDSRGHGKTPFNPDVPSSFNAFTDDVITVMDKCGIQQAIAGGISMGSGIAVNMALRYPHRVAAIILLRPAWKCEAEPENLKILSHIASVVNHSGGREEFMQAPEFRTIAEKHPNAATSVLGMFNRDQQMHTASILKSMVQDQPCSSDPTLLSVPALIIGNEDDPLHPWQMAVEWNEILAESKLIQVTSRYLDDEKHRIETVTAIQEFINKLTI
ncbi:alpha/beta fold hydrolase [Fulvivirga sedimenti]|uniref:Alpha/beta hydrolase n=1 Tax=Fulvivirga sedimenti TaxID=2879465 RepID=A0A9X1HUW3_9BACT|nr:alpha/beta fold hydrolase [Fulvivirga sedimenti]MCA6078345.1 alpha/beta hydrolase [Fulvivirga sedimenti]